MARSRMIKPEFWDDEKLSKVSRDARLIFIGLWNHSDDYGVVKGNAVWLKNHILPYEDSLSIQKFSGWLTELEKGGWIIKFDADGESFYFIRNFLRHQSINRPSKQRNPIPPDNINEHSLSPHGVLTDETETETETEYSSEPQGDTEQEPLFTFPLVNKNENGEPEQHPIYQTDISEWQFTYSGVDVLAAVKACRQWNINNPTKRKTKTGIMKHINTWLNKAQNSGSYKRTTKPEEEKNTGFNPSNCVVPECLQNQK